VFTPFYDWDGRKYFELKLEDTTICRVKIPWRYNRVACKVEGLKTVQEFKKGDEVVVEIQKKVWDGIEYLILQYIRDANT